MFSGLESLDHDLFVLINIKGAYPALDPVFRGFSVLGEWAIALIALIFLSARGSRTLWRHVAILVLTILALSPIRGEIKRHVNRQRPTTFFPNEATEPKVKARLLDPSGGGSQSFPSGHSMLAFFVMTYVALNNRSQRAVALTLAFLIAYSRVYVGVHFPSDCVAGSLLGAAAGWLAWRLFRLTDRLRAARAGPAPVSNEPENTSPDAGRRGQQAQE